MAIVMKMLSREVTHCASKMDYVGILEVFLGNLLRGGNP